jgi:putative glutamine amidotransferase
MTDLLSDHEISPVIGICLDSEPAGGYAIVPWYALRENYADVVHKTGGIPIFLPHEPSHIEHYLSMIHGIIVPGGNFDIDPTTYGASNVHETVVMKHKRSAFEMGLTRRAFAQSMPILGICGGEQLINVILGGTLIQHIPDQVPHCLEHEQKHHRAEVGHEVSIVPGTRLHQMMGTLRTGVNTSHHQAIDRVGEGLVINARADDGVIEGIEHTEHPFCIGVQWHPEYEVTPSDTLIFKAFVDAARSYHLTHISS